MPHQISAIVEMTALNADTAGLMTILSSGNLNGLHAVALTNLFINTEILAVKTITTNCVVKSASIAKSLGQYPTLTDGSHQK